MKFSIFLIVSCLSISYICAETKEKTWGNIDDGKLLGRYLRPTRSSIYIYISRSNNRLKWYKKCLLISAWCEYLFNFSFFFCRLQADVPSLLFISSTKFQRHTLNSLREALAIIRSQSEFQPIEMRSFATLIFINKHKQKPNMKIKLKWIWKIFKNEENSDFQACFTPPQRKHTETKFGSKRYSSCILDCFFFFRCSFIVLRNKSISCEKN